MEYAVFLYKAFTWIFQVVVWQIDGETVETVADFVFFFFGGRRGCSKITADGDGSHEEKDTYSLEGKLRPT